MLSILYYLLKFVLCIGSIGYSWIIVCAFVVFVWWPVEAAPPRGGRRETLHCPSSGPWSRPGLPKYQNETAVLSDP